MREIARGGDKMPDFTPLPVYGGVGPVHFNRFRAVFQKPNQASAATLADTFATSFPKFFNSKFATVEWGSRTFGSNPTLKFHGFLYKLGIDLGGPHHDWVEREWFDHRVGFTVQTLKREFIDFADDAKAGVGGALGSYASPLLPGGAAAQLAVHYNRMHFLAGRRSWRVGEGKIFDESPNALVVETIAVERFSANVFMAGDSVLGLEKAIPDIRIANLTNFINLSGLAALDSAKKGSLGWVSRGPVCFFMQKYNGYFGLFNSAEFQNAFQLYPTILPPKT
jgi:hypothetical protein